MSIQSEISRIAGNIASAYTALSVKGATMPSVQNTANLAGAIESIAAGEAMSIETIRAICYTPVYFAQPILTANGTLGGSSFAVSASNYYSADYAAYKAFNGSMNDGYSSSVNPSNQTIYLTFYNPVAIKVSALTFTNVPSGLTSSSPKAFSVQGSNDNSAWATIGSFTNENNTNGARWRVSLHGDYYKYHRIVITSANTTQAYVNIGEIAITAIL